MEHLFFIATRWMGFAIFTANIACHLHISMA